MYCPPCLMCVPTLPWRKWIVKLPRVQQLILVYFHKTFFRFQAQFWHFLCRNTPEEHFGIIPTTCEFLCVITNHATDAVKTVVNTVNVNFRKLKKNNVRNTNKTSQFKQEVLELSSVGILQECSIRITVSPSPDLVSGISYLRLCVYHRHLDSFKASWRQYFFARPTRHDSARSTFVTA